MLCQNEIDYLIMLAQDYVNTLPGSSKVAVAEHADKCLKSVIAHLNVAEELMKTIPAPSADPSPAETAAEILGQPAVVGYEAVEPAPDAS
jgi:hypothetical protein